MRVLDLFCGAGLVADGLVEAGCEVVGVDLTPQKNYPYAFIRHDALTLDMRFIRSFDAVWASPPCLRDTALRTAPGAKGDLHPELIPATRKLLKASGLPYVIENVETAPLIDPVILCGRAFGLGAHILQKDGSTPWYHLERHRKFETNWPLSRLKHDAHTGPVVGVYGGHARCRSAAYGGRGTADFVGHKHRDIMGRAMGIPDDRRITCDEISQGIPPAYAKYVAEQLWKEPKWMRRRLAPFDWDKSIASFVDATAVAGSSLAGQDG